MPRIIRHVIWPIGEALNYSEGRLLREGATTRCCCFLIHILDRSVARL